MSTKMFPVGTRVEVKRRREGGPDIVLRGKVISASPDHAAVECWIADGPHVIYWRGEDTPHISLRRLTGRDFQRRR